jgi:phenylacetate-CoA ligase
MSEINRFHCSSGTTGKPICIPQTAEDVKIWTDGVMRCMAMYGITKDDVVQVSYGYGLFTGGLGAHYGAEKLGCAVLPTGAGNTEKQLMLMQDLDVTLLCCTPSYALQIAEVAQRLGIDLHKLPLKAGFFGAEPWTDAMRHHIEQAFPLKALDIYGMTELSGPGVAHECLEQNGLHVWEDYFYPEIIDPDTGEPLPDGQQGELVVTCLAKEGMPLVRYRTRDITKILPGRDCPCGRTHRRIARLRGRTDDMLIIRGVNVFPSQIEDVLIRIDGVLPNYLITVDRQGNLDTMEIKVEVTEKSFTDHIKGLEALREDIAAKLKSVITVGARIVLVEPNSLARGLGKAKRVVDLRKL